MSERVKNLNLQENYSTSRRVFYIGHYVTGNLEMILGSDADLERAKPLLLRCYEKS